MPHTPGPWNWHAPLPSQGIKHFMVHEAIGDIAEVYAWDFTEASEANARLIAAAPDLLAALEAASPWLQHLAKGNVGTGRYECNPQTCPKHLVDAAIGKAENPVDNQ